MGWLRSIEDYPVAGVVTSAVALRREAVSLGMFWLATAVVVDYVGFVLIKNPISISPHDFYVGQFPWIYLILSGCVFCSVVFCGFASEEQARA